MKQKKDDINRILIIGMAGGLAQILSGLLIKTYPGVQIIGVDPRPITESIQNDQIEYMEFKYTRGNFEKLFRDKQFDLVFQLARMSHANVSPRSNLAQRLDSNIMGTKRIMDLSLQFKVKKLFILSTYHVYGALSTNPVFVSEDHPLKAGINHQELRDVVEMDQIATTWMWKNQKEIETVILRPCSILGPTINNTMTRYLTTPYVPICADFNPMFQFIHEFDMAQIMIKAIHNLPTGIFNVATDEVISLKSAKEYLKTPALPIPSLLLHGANKVLNTTIWKFPDYLIDYIQFACIIDNSLLKSHLGDQIFRYTTKETLELAKLS